MPETARLKPRMSAASAPVVARVDDYIRRYNVCGSMYAFHSIAADVFDGLYVFEEVQDLVERGFVETFSLSGGRSTYHVGICGRTWSVIATEDFIRAFWPERLTEGNKP